MWPRNGLLAASSQQSFTVSYGPDGDTEGDAPLAFRDDRSGSLEITVARLSADGFESGGMPMWSTAAP